MTGLICLCIMIFLIMFSTGTIIYYVVVDHLRTKAYYRRLLAGDKYYKHFKFSFEGRNMKKNWFWKLKQRWMKYCDEDVVWHCSNCGWLPSHYNDLMEKNPNYCPQCGGEFVD